MWALLLLLSTLALASSAPFSLSSDAFMDIASPAPYDQIRDLQSILDGDTEEEPPLTPPVTAKIRQILREMRILFPDGLNREKSESLHKLHQYLNEIEQLMTAFWMENSTSPPIFSGPLPRRGGEAMEIPSECRLALRLPAVCRSYATKYGQAVSLSFEDLFR